MKQKVQEAPKRLNIWKIVAIAVIFLFAGTLLFSLVKLHRFRQTLVDPTGPQVDAAKALALQDLESRGLNTSEYSIKVSPKVRGIRDAGEDKNIIQVFAEANASRHSYLIDTENDMILLHSQTEVYGWMADMERRMFGAGPAVGEGGCSFHEGGNGIPEKPCTREGPGRVSGFPIYPMHRRE